MAAILVMAAIGGWAVTTERLSYVVTYGISMNPVYHEDDLVFVLKADSYRLGDIAAYRTPSSGVEVLHRIIGGNARAGFLFKGDNNQSVDPEDPSAEQLMGRAVLLVPKGGVWLKPVLSPTGLGMMGFLIVSGGVALPRNRREIPRGRRKKKVKAMSRQGSPVAAVIKTVSQMPLPMQVASGLVAVVGCLAVALGVLGWMKPVLEEVPPSEPAQTMTFSYSAKVPKTAAYDGTVVTSPDPVFRKLAERVDLKIRYDGRPGTLDASATLSNDSGWHTTTPLAAPKTFSGRSTDVTTVLDLKAMEDRAKDAAKAIGIDAGAIAIKINARVKKGSTELLNAALNLQLDGIRLNLAGGEGTLVVRDATAPEATFVPREIGSIMTAAQARAYALLMLIVTVVGAVAIALLARRKLPFHTRDDIERRFPSLLVHVEQMASPPGKPVVNVDNFPALVKLAERYGQMILTWRRPDADDFVVRDEGITYRYRIPLEETALQNVEHINRPPNAGSHRRKDSSQVS